MGNITALQNDQKKPRNMKSLAKHEAFINAIKTGETKTKAQLVYLALLKEPRTIEFFRTTLGMAHQSCTAVLSHLEDTGWVYKLRSVRSSSSNKLFTLYAAETNLEEAKLRAEQVFEYKKQCWVEKGVKHGWLRLQMDNTQNEVRNFGNESQDKFQGD